ncbi:MAG: SwmB domain-containing protein [Chloroflexota bacterium]|nr:SwmB domain-containing protein [Chloroflexota bacterium]
MFRPAITVSAALLASLAVLWLPTSSAGAESALTADSARVDGATLTVTLSAEVDTGSSAVDSDFTVSAGDSTATVDSASVSGSAITLTLDESVVDPDCDSAAISVGYAKSGSSITASGVELTDFSDLAASNQTDHPPAIASLETDVNGGKVLVTFCEAIVDISNQWSNFSAFSVSVNGTAQGINDLVTPSGSAGRLEILLSGSGAIKEGDAVTLAYDQSKADRNYPLRDLDQGNKQVETWTARAVTNRVDNPPTLESATALYDVVTLTFNEALDEESEPATGAFAIRGVQHAPSVQRVAISGATVSLTLSGILNKRGSAVYSVRYTAPSESPLRQADGAHDVASFTSALFDSSTPTTKPAVSGAAVNGTEMTISFDLPLKKVAGASAFTIAGEDGVTVSGSSFSGSVVTLTLSPGVSAGSTITVSYKKPNSPPRIEARNNKDADSFMNQSVTNNTVAPKPEFSSAAVSADGATLTIVFSLALDESAESLPAASTFSLSGTSASVDAVTIDAATVVLSLDPLADIDETITVGYAPPTDEMAARLQAAGDAQAVAAFSAQEATNHADGKPRPISAEVDGDGLTVSFDRDLDADSLPATTAFTLAGTTASVANRSINGSELRLTLSRAVDHTESLSLSYSAPTEAPLKRAGKEIQVDSFTVAEVDNATTDPTPSFSSASIDASGGTLTVVMSHSLLATSAGVPGTSAFTISGSAQAAIASVSIDGAIIELGLNPAADVNETVTVSYQAPTDASEPALQSADGMWKTAAWSGESVTNGADGKPRPVGATVDADSLVLRFDRALDEGASPPKADFSVTPAGISVKGIAIDGQTVTLTLSREVEHDDAVTVSYSAAGMVKLKRSGHEILATTFSGIVVENVTPEPLVRSVVGDGVSIVVAFSVTLDDNSEPAATAFSLGADQPSISKVTISGMTLTLTLSESLVEGEEYTLSYTHSPTSPLQMSDGTAITELPASVTNKTDVAPTVAAVDGDGDTVTITFDQPLDEMAVIANSSFALAGSVERTVSGTSIDVAMLSLTLSVALTEDEDASLSYTKPEADGIVDPTGHQAEGFSRAIDNQTDTAPVPVSGTVDEDTIVIVLDQELADDPRYGEDATCPYPAVDGEERTSYPIGHFTLTGTAATIDFICVSHEGPGGHGRIEIQLSESVEPGETVVITYFPVSGTIRIKDDDPSGNRAVFRDYELTNLTKAPPDFEEAKVNGASLTVVFDQKLDPDLEPEPGWFALEAVAAEDDSPLPWGSDVEIAVAAASVSDKSLLLQVAPSVAEDVEYQLTYSAPAAGGLVGESGKAVTGLAAAVSVANDTDYAPYPVAIQTNKTGTMVEVTFDQRFLPTSSRDPSWYSFGAEIRVTSVDFRAYEHGKPQLAITLHVSTPIREGASVRLTYTPPKSGGLQDDDGENGGHLVEAFDEAVENLVDVAPLLERVTVNRRLVRLEFDQPLDADHVPPPNCEWLESEGEVGAGFCADEPGLYWFRVVDAAEIDRTIESVQIDGVAVELMLTEPVGAGESIRVVYRPQSLADGRWNLRDTQPDESSVANLVAETDPTAATNITAASPSSAVFDRAQPTEIVLEFDGGLPSGAGLSTDLLEVSVDGSPVRAKGLSTSGSTLTISLAEPVPECSSLELSYRPGEQSWLDAAERTIEAFQFSVGNYIDRSRGLSCVQSDLGGMALSFSEPTSTAQDVEIEWALSVNGEEREITVEESEGVVRLVPNPAVCVGDRVAIVQTRSDLEADLSLNRVIDQAAPCAVSAVATGTSLRVLFDRPLDPSLPTTGDFTIDDETDVEAVVGIDGRTLSLQLVPPGVNREDGATLSYEGSSLSGGGLSVGRFSLLITDRTEPPALVSGYGVDELIVLQFDQPLLGRTVPAARFIPTGPGLEVGVDSVQIGGSTVYLHLSSGLPDEPDLFGVVYLARERGGLAGRTGARVPDSVFLVRNYTETPPSVLGVVVDSRRAMVSFDQRIDGAEAQPTDFVLFAGRRRIEATGLEWSRSSVVISLAGRVTSPDSVLLLYRPGAEGAVRDLSEIPLAAFEIWAENRTDSPDGVEEVVEDARLRSSAGGTTFERELARGFASSGGTRFTALPGMGRSSVAHGDLALSIDVGRLSSGPLVLRVSELRDASEALTYFERVPAWCWRDDEASTIRAWLVGESDLHGVPTDHGMAVSIVGLVDGGWANTVCVLDLITGSWRVWRAGSEIPTPSLILERVGIPLLSWDRLLLVG